MKRREEIMAELYVRYTDVVMRLGTAYTGNDPDRMCDLVDRMVERTLAKIYPVSADKR